MGLGGKSFEALERTLARQGADLVKRAILEAEGPRCVAAVERIVRMQKWANTLDYLFGTTQWQEFRVLYPVASARIEREEREKR